MDTFAFVIHPIHPKRDISRKFPLLGLVANDWTIRAFAPMFPALYISEITGVTSVSTGKQINGWFVACPLTPQLILELPEKVVYRKIIETGLLATKLGAQIFGLGAYTSVVGDAGETVARALEIPVTTGDSYTVAIALQAVDKAAEMMEIPLRSAVTAVVGATGTIGQVCAEILAEKVGRLYLIARHQEPLEALQRQIHSESAGRSGWADLEISTILDVLPQAHLILTVTSALGTIIEPEHLRPGSVVCDVARPRDVSTKVATAREDVLVIDGGMVDVPGPVDFHFDFGFPPGKAYACMAETMALALEGRFEDYTVGKNISRARVEEITGIADKHGFRLSGFRSFELPVSAETITRVRQKAKNRL